MMKYMDGILSIQQAKELNTHLQMCEICKEEFYAYEMITQEFEVTGMLQAPIDFEAVVMEKIKDIEPDYLVKASKEKQVAAMDNLLGMVWGVFSFLFGIGMLLFMYRDSILDYLINNSYVGKWVQSFVPTVSVLSEYIGQIQQTATSLITPVQELISSSKMALATILVVLGVIQYVLYHREKVEA